MSLADFDVVIRELAGLDIKGMHIRYFHLSERCKALSQYKARAKASYTSLQKAYNDMVRIAMDLKVENTRLHKEIFELRHPELKHLKMDEEVCIPTREDWTKELPNQIIPSFNVKTVCEECDPEKAKYSENKKKRFWFF